MAAADRTDLPPSAVEELGFWERELTLQGEHPEVVRARVDPSQREGQFPPFLKDPVGPLLRAHFGVEALRCLELGPGPLSSLAWGVDQGLLEVTAVDVLAAEFCELIDQHGFGDYPIRPVVGSGETLAERFGEAAFHVTFVRNALDHTDDLPRSFDNLVRCTLPGGAIVLQHHLNEGKHREWSDSHHWNLDLGEGGLRAEDRQGKRYDVGKRDDLELVYLSYRNELLDGWIDAIYRRV